MLREIRCICGEIREILWFIFINRIVSSKLVLKRVRCGLYRILGFDIQHNQVYSGCYIGSRNIVIRKGGGISYGVFFDTMALIDIGENCFIGPETMFCTATHEIGPKEKRMGKLRSECIKVGNGCWIGARALILPGVTIGDGCVIGAGAVVTKNCESNGLYAGNPAKRIRDLPVD